MGILPPLHMKSLPPKETIMRFTALALAATLGFAAAGPALAEGCSYAKPQQTVEMSKPEAKSTAQAQVSTPATGPASADVAAPQPVETAAATTTQPTVKPN
jgi:hypothetical protein